MSLRNSRRTARLRPHALVLLGVAWAADLDPSHAPAPSRPGVVYYLSPDGSDQGPGSASRPWRTFARALPRLGPGDTLLVRGGRYVENVRNPRIEQGREDARITVAAYRGERPVLVGLLSLRRPSYWTLNGINVTWSEGNPSTTHMVKLTDGVGWVLENAELWGARSYAALLVYGSTPGEPSGWTVRDNCVHDTRGANRESQDQNLYINTGTSAGRGLVERNVIFGALNGMNVKLGYGRSSPEPGDGTANVTVRYNTMFDAGKNVMLTDESHDNTIERNIIVGSTSGWAIRAYRLSGANNVVRDNVFSGQQRGLQYADPGFGSVIDGGGNVSLDPRFEARGCDGLRPTAPGAHAYGRHAK